MPESTLSPAVRPAIFSAGVVVVRREAADWRLLVLRAYRHWDFPKGLVEAGETPLQAAIRETAEESGIDDLTFRWGEAYCETAPYGLGKVARYHLAETARRSISLPVSPELGRPEHDEWRWLSFDEARHLLPPRLQPILDWAETRLASWWPLALLPFQGLDEAVLSRLAGQLGDKGFACSLLLPTAIDPEAYNPERRQYRAEALLEATRQAAPGRVLGVTGLDLYARGFNYVFGMAEKQGRAAVISTNRLHDPDPARFQERMLKEAVHELGHTLGLVHCREPDCVMHFSNTLADTDRKGAEFCVQCRARLKSKGADL